MTSNSYAVRVRALSKAFGARRVLDNFELDLQAGEFVALLGQSGSGKTTLLRILAGLESWSSGEAWVRSPCTMVFQEPRLLESKRVFENVLWGLEADDTASERAERALDEVGLTHLANAWPWTLSGGEAQRVSLARALLRQPRLLLLDEPFAALDALTRLKMQALVAELCARHRPAVLLVTHDVDEAVLLADRVLVLRDGQIQLSTRVPWPRPRTRSGAEFEALRARLLAALGFDGARAAEPPTRSTAP